jgi:hypothetical protein
MTLALSAVIVVANVAYSVREWRRQARTGR